MIVDEILIIDTAIRLRWRADELKKIIAFTPDVVMALKNAEFNDRAFENHTEDEWIKLRDPEILQRIRPIVDPKYASVYDDPREWESVTQDISKGEPFCFFWRDNFLQWER